MAKRGVAWPPPKGWRRDLEEKHRLGLRVLPLPPLPEAQARRLARDGRRGADREARGQHEVPVRAPQVWVNDIGEMDPADPPPWV